MNQSKYYIVFLSYIFYQLIFCNLVVILLTFHFVISIFYYYRKKRSKSFFKFLKRIFNIFVEHDKLMRFDFAIIKFSISKLILIFIFISFYRVFCFRYRQCKSTNRKKKNLYRINFIDKSFLKRNVII